MCQRLVQEVCQLFCETMFICHRSLGLGLTVRDELGRNEGGWGGGVLLCFVCDTSKRWCLCLLCHSDLFCHGCVCHSAKDNLFTSVSSLLSRWDVLGNLTSWDFFSFPVTHDFMLSDVAAIIPADVCEIIFSLLRQCQIWVAGEAEWGTGFNKPLDTHGRKTAGWSWTYLEVRWK